MQKFTEIHPPKLEPQTFQQYLKEVLIVLKEMEKSNSQLIGKLTSKITKLEKSCLEK